MLFDSIDWRAMESSFKALSMKEQVISQNLANQDTPDYKQVEFNFKNVLADAQGSVDVEKSKDMDYEFVAQTFTDTSRNILIDGNSVDTDQQQLELYNVYLQHSAMITKMNGDFKRFSTVATANFS
ncbi:MAG: flagellar basal body rod protein FlgB [Oscillospiraceae bacterium]|jgi:flagellar basal-body rod protein FlgB|nr:flagellar basal body rod protein FlgB [Oscillospiraceae bacterium]